MEDFTCIAVGVFIEYVCLYVQILYEKWLQYTIVYSTVYSDADQRKHQSSPSLAFVGEFTGNRLIPRTNVH